MNIWRLRFELDMYDNLTPAKKWSHEKIQSFDGRKQLDNWKAVKVIRLEPEKNLPLSDAPGFYSHIPVFNRKVIDVLGEGLKDKVELLPLKNKEDEYYALNVINVLDCIDYSNSDYMTFPDGKRIYRFKKYCFFETKVLGENIFKIKDEPRQAPFVSDQFKNIVEEHGFTGFKFSLAWSTDKKA